MTLKTNTPPDEHDRLGELPLDDKIAYAQNIVTRRYGPADRHEVRDVLACFRQANTSSGR